MKTIVTSALFFAIAVASIPGAAEAKGCIKGAMVGGVAGHLAHHHGLIGAAIGCVIGHHEAKKREREEREHALQPAQ